MGIDSGFAFDGFVDDREERKMWGNVEKLTKSSVSSDEENEIVDGKMEINDDGKSDWQEDMQKSSIKSTEKEKCKK